MDRLDPCCGAVSPECSARGCEAVQWLCPVSSRCASRSSSDGVSASLAFFVPGGDLSGGARLLCRFVFCRLRLLLSRDSPGRSMTWSGLFGWPFPRLRARRRSRSLSEPVVTRVSGPFIVGQYSKVCPGSSSDAGAVLTALTDDQLRVLIREKGVAVHSLKSAVQSFVRMLEARRGRRLGVGPDSTRQVSFVELCRIEEQLALWQREYGIVFTWLRSGRERCERYVSPCSLSALWQLCVALGVAEVVLSPSVTGRSPGRVC